MSAEVQRDGFDVGADVVDGAAVERVARDHRAVHDIGLHLEGLDERALLVVTVAQLREELAGQHCVEDAAFAPPIHHRITGDHRLDVQEASRPPKGDFVMLIVEVVLLMKRANELAHGIPPVER